MLDNAWKGYNCSLFAYGQTGSGKSYSIVGFGKNKGIVPMVCEELFRRIDENKENKESKKGQTEYQVIVFCERNIFFLFRSPSQCLKFIGRKSETC